MCCHRVTDLTIAKGNDSLVLRTAIAPLIIVVLESCCLPRRLLEEDEEASVPFLHNAPKTTASTQRMLEEANKQESKTQYTKTKCMY